LLCVGNDQSANSGDNTLYSLIVVGE
jgi:hypothetical protein